MAEKKVKTQTFSIVLLHENIKDNCDCLKDISVLCKVKLRKYLNMDGVIFYKETVSNPPKWKKQLDELAIDPINIKNNSSNSVVVILKIKGRFAVLLYGHGRNLLKDDCIIHDFGLKVALNILDPEKMRSVDVTTIENSMLSSRKQASYSTDQNGFEINTLNDILRGVTGHPLDEEKYGVKVTGKDVLFASFKLKDFSELREKIELYLEAYEGDKYKEHFGWIDNIKKVRQSNLINELNEKLEDALDRKEYDNIFLSPPELIDWSNIISFKIEATKKKIKKIDNLDLDINDYVQFAREIDTRDSLISLMKKHHLYAICNDGYVKSLSNIYRALTAQISIGKYKYILSDNDWYQIDGRFYDSVKNYITTNISRIDLKLPCCPLNYHENAYNEYAVSKNPEELCLMDQRLISVENGRKIIECCDIFSLNKIFIHVKNYKGSSLLSHLFSQGYVSAQCFVQDKYFREQFFECIQSKFPSKKFDADRNPSFNEYCVVFAIIGIDADKDIAEALPFFSLVNLKSFVQNLNNIGFKTMYCFVPWEKESSI